MIEPKMVEPRTTKELLLGSDASTVSVGSWDIMNSSHAFRLGGNQVGQTIDFITAEPPVSKDIAHFFFFQLGNFLHLGFFAVHSLRYCFLLATVDV